MPYAPTDRYDSTAREPIPFLYADVFHWNMSLVSQLWKPARSFCTSYVEGGRGTSYKEMLDDVDDTLVPPRSKARAAIFKTTAHVSVARRDQEVHYRVLADGYAGAAHGGCCPICQTLYQRDTTERTRHTYWDCPHALLLIDAAWRAVGRVTGKFKVPSAPSAEFLSAVKRVALTGMNERAARIPDEPRLNAVAIIQRLLFERRWHNAAQSSLEPLEFSTAALYADFVRALERVSEYRLKVAQAREIWILVRYPKFDLTEKGPVVEHWKQWGGLVDEDDNRIRLPRSLDAVGGAAAGAHTATYVITRMVAVGDRVSLRLGVGSRVCDDAPIYLRGGPVSFSAEALADVAAGDDGHDDDDAPPGGAAAPSGAAAAARGSPARRGPAAPPSRAPPPRPPPDADAPPPQAPPDAAADAPPPSARAAPPPAAVAPPLVAEDSLPDDEPLLPPTDDAPLPPAADPRPLPSDAELPPPPTDAALPPVPSDVALPPLPTDAALPPPPTDASLPPPSSGASPRRKRPRYVEIRRPPGRPRAKRPRIDPDRPSAQEPPPPRIGAKRRAFLILDADDPPRRVRRRPPSPPPARVPHPDARIPPAPPLRRFPLWDSIVRRFGRYINGSSRAFVRMRGLGRAHHPG